MDATPDAALIEQRTDELLRAPGGLTLLALVDGTGVTDEYLADPLVTTHYVIDTMNLISPWDQLTPARLELLADLTPELRPLARRLVASPALAWWWRPLDRSRPQLWSNGGVEFMPLDRARGRGPTSFERYAHKPEGSTLTSSLLGDGWSMVLIGTFLGLDDMYLPEEFDVMDRRLLRIRTDSRIYEINGPDDWGRLCHRFPDVRPAGLNGPADPEECVPDWRQVAGHWDGVHVSVGGLLTATDRWVEHSLGKSRLWAWDCECSYWLRDVFVTSTSLPPLPRDSEPFYPGASSSVIDPAFRPGWLLNDSDIIAAGDGPAARQLAADRINDYPWTGRTDSDQYARELLASGTRIGRVAGERLSRRP